MPPTIPAAGSPIGFFVPSPGVGDAVTPMLADDINEETHDYNTILTGFDAIDAQVLIALKTFRNSGAAVVEVGQRYRDNSKLTDDIEEIIRSDTRRALHLLITKGDIQLVDNGIQVKIYEDAQAAEVEVTYKNMRQLDPKAQKVRKRLPEAI
jgi:hypothetical protein